MMRTLSSGLLHLALLACLLTFTACTQTTEDKLLVENQLNEFSKDFKLMKAEMQDLEMEIEVLNEQLDYLRQVRTTGSTVDEKQVRGLESRIATMETSLSDVKMRAASVEVRTTAMEKKTASLSIQVAALPKQLEAVKSTFAARPKAPSGEPASAMVEPPQAAPAEARSATPSPGFYYTLQRGDTIESVAETLQIEGRIIRTSNRVPDGFQPLIGQRIYIPTAQ